MTISLTKTELRWLEAEVAAGRLASVEEGVHRALDQFMLGGGPLDDADIETDDPAWAKPLVDEALEEVERGEGHSAADVKGEMHAYLKSIGAR